MLSTLATKVLGAAGVVLAADQAPAAASGDRGALYVAASGVLVALISANAVIRTKAPAPTPVPYVVDDQLTDELSGLYRQAEHRAARAELEAEMWKARALQHGWQQETG